MKYWYKAVLIALLISCLLSTSVYAALPYKGYTYDQWGNAVPAPDGYVPDRFLTGPAMGTSDFDGPQDIFVNNDLKRVYIADTGNNRIVAVDGNFKFLYEISELTTGTGETDGLRSPGGVFVDGEENIYIADTKNARIVKCDKHGKILKIIGAPQNAALGGEFDYIPIKLIVDRDGLLYVQALNVYQGILCMDENGNFIQFFGSSRVDVTAQVLFQQLLRKFMTKEQRAGMISFINTEYSNLYIDDKGFIYAVVSKSANSVNEIKKINSMGDNILRVNPYGNSALYLKNNYGDYPILHIEGSYTPIDTSFVDIHYDEEGMISALDSSRGRVFVYDEESNLMFVFGTLGTQLGSFGKPVALEKLDGRMLVLDSATNGITVFKLTEFGQNVIKAIRLYNDGRYLEAIDPWNEVLRQDSNYNLAYDGLGKAYLRLEEYRTAMGYFKLGYDKVGYSKAFGEYTTKLARDHIAVIFTMVVIFGALPFVLPSLIGRVRRRARRKEMGL